MEKISEISSNEMKILEINSEFFGVSRADLMKNAGNQIADQILNSEVKLTSKSKVAFFCGTGGNGGDGFVASNLLSEKYQVDVFITGHEQKIKSISTLANFLLIKTNQSITITHISKTTDLDSIDLESYDVIVDALLGTGIISENIREPVNSLITKLNVSNIPIFSVDMPSGLMENGKAANNIIKPEYTISLHQPKIGTYLYGKNVINVDIGINANVKNNTGPGILINLQKRDENSHKGQNGKLLIIGGSKTYHGAPILAAKAALSMNVDLVTLIVPEKIKSAVQSHSARYIVNSYKGPYLTKQIVKDQILPLISEMDSVLIGPGLGANLETISAVEYFISNFNSSATLIIDADALKACSSIQFPKKCILTPHMGEFGMITKAKINGLSLDQKLEKLFENSSKFDTHTVWLLKGKIDIIVQGQRFLFNDTGIPELTVGGTGDILAGLTAGLSCFIDDPFTVASMSSFLIGISAELQVNSLDWFFFDQIFDWIPLAILEIRKFIREEKNDLENLRKRNF